MVSLKNIAVAAAAIVGYVHAAPSSFRKNSNIIEDSYVIRLKPGVADFQAHTSWVTNVHKRNLAKRSGVKHYKGIEREFNFEHVKTKGYSGVFDHATIEEIRNSDAVSRQPTKVTFCTLKYPLSAVRSERFMGGELKGSLGGPSPS